MNTTKDALGLPMSPKDAAAAKKFSYRKGSHAQPIREHHQGLTNSKMMFKSKKGNGQSQINTKVQSYGQLPKIGVINNIVQEKDPKKANVVDRSAS